ENAESVSILSLSTRRLDLLESTLTFWENVVHDVSETSIQSHSNIDFDDSMSCANSPVVSCARLDFEVQPKSLRINTNSESVIVVVPDPFALAPESDAVVVPVPVALAPESDAVVVPHPVALNEQPVVTAPVT
ncbi:heat stress transcription factor A-4A-like, partial [Trifolium medium]|nr:heat stress transcription factor A-4A-like [Trifolium medium]